MEKEFIFPIHKLDLDVTKTLTLMYTAGIADSLANNLDNVIEFTDLCGPITIMSSIHKDSQTGKSHVKLSAAFFQFLWMISKVSIRMIDAHIVDDQRKAMSDKDKKVYAEYIKMMKGDTYALLKEIDDIKQVMQQTFEEFKQAVKLIDTQYDKDSVRVFEHFPYNTQYGLKTNSVCKFGITYILLHEHAHYMLGHMEKQKITIDEEIEADDSAFKAICSDIPDDQRFTAYVGILNALFSFVILNPTFKKDDIHPQEYKRLLRIYERIKGEKYTILVVHFFKMWASYLNLHNFPDIPYNDEGVQQIKEYIENTYLSSNNK